MAAKVDKEPVSACTHGTAGGAATCMRVACVCVLRVCVLHVCCHQEMKPQDGRAKAGEMLGNARAFKWAPALPIRPSSSTCFGRSNWYRVLFHALLSGLVQVPVSSEPVPDTIWSEVKCEDDRVYYFNTETEVCPWGARAQSCVLHASALQ